MAQTLEELKAENAKDEEEAQARLDASQANESDDFEADDEENLNSENAEWLQGDESDEEEPEVLDNAEEDDSEQLEPDQDENQERTVPLKELISTRTKLKTKLKENQNEVDSLKARIAELESGKTAKSTNDQAVPVSNIQNGPAPKLEDFDSHEDFLDARDAWKEKQLLAKSNQAQQQKQLEEQKAQVAKANEEHLDRAAKMIDQHKIDPNSFNQAERTFRSALDGIKPGTGDALAEALISMIGDGSEKLVFMIGRNSAKREQLISAIKADPVGGRAMMLLGEWKGEIKAPSKRKTQAPRVPPSSQGNASRTSLKGLKQKYAKAEKAGDAQAMIDIKDKARASGENTSDW